MYWLHLTSTETFFRAFISADRLLVTKFEIPNHHSDAAAALVGSLGLVPSVNAGDNFVMGEP